MRKGRILIGGWEAEGAAPIRARMPEPDVIC
jgi:hypothetical protein